MELEDKERQPVECYVRVMGYFRPVSQFNDGKQSEFKERVCFSENHLESHEPQKVSEK